MKTKKHKKSYAELAKAVMQKYKSRLGENLDKDDPLARKAMERELAELAAEQESVKQSMEMDQMNRTMAYGGGLPQMYDAGIIPEEDPEVRRRMLLNQIGAEGYPINSITGIETGRNYADFGPVQTKNILSPEIIRNLSTSSASNYNPATSTLSQKIPKGRWGPGTKVTPQSSTLIPAITQPTSLPITAPGPYSQDYSRYNIANRFFDPNSQMTKQQNAFGPPLTVDPAQHLALNKQELAKAMGKRAGGPGPNNDEKLQWTAYAAPAIQGLTDLATLAFLNKRTPETSYNEPQMEAYQKADMSEMYRSVKEASIDAQRSIGGSDQYTAKAYKNKIASDYAKQMAGVSAEENKINTEGLNAYNRDKYALGLQSAKARADVSVSNNLLKTANNKDIADTIGRFGTHAAMFPQNVAQYNSDLMTGEAMSRGNAVRIGGKIYNQPEPGFYQSGTEYWLPNGDRTTSDEYYKNLLEYRKKMKKEPDAVAKNK